MTKKSKNAGVISDLKELLTKGDVRTQDDICRVLGEMGHDVNQSKVSRLLRKIGAIKVTNDQNQIVYQLPKEPAPPAPDSRFSSYISKIDANEFGICVRTVPGSAQLVGRLIDYNAEKCGCLGTVAGDDTIFVIPKTIHNIEDTVNRLKLLLGM